MLPALRLIREARTPLAYVGAFLLTGLGWLLARQTPVGAFPHVPFLVFMLVVVGSGALGGRGPAMLAAALALLVVDYEFIPSAGTFKLPYTWADATSVLA